MAAFLTSYATKRLPVHCVSVRHKNLTQFYQKNFHQYLLYELQIVNPNLEVILFVEVIVNQELCDSLVIFSVLHSLKYKIFTYYIK